MPNLKVIHLNRAKILSSAKLRKFTDVYMVCILWHIVVKYKLKLYRNFEHKGDKATVQTLDLKTKTIKSKHSSISYHYLKQFPQTLSFCYIMPTSISIFLFPSKVSVLVHFQESLFVSNANFQRFGLTFSC